MTYRGNEPSGAIVIRTNERRLNLVRGDGTAIRYPVGVGRAGKQWEGWSEVEGKHVDPAWSPPEEVRADNPRLPEVIPGGAPGNPMGLRALTLAGGEYAIHGTNKPKSIGTFASYGCIRMYNEDIVDLFDQVRVGTPVVVRNLRGCQETVESRRWPPSNIHEPIFTASGTTRSNPATVQIQRLIPDNPLAALAWSANPCEVSEPSPGSALIGDQGSCRGASRDRSRRDLRRWAVKPACHRHICSACALQTVP